MTPPIITVTAAILKKDGLILAARRKPGSHLAGYWEFPGGKLEANETPEQCLARELEEEFNIQVTVGNFIGENTHDYGHKLICLMAYKVRWISGDFVLRDHDAVKWLRTDELGDLTWAPADVPLLDLIA